MYSELLPIALTMGISYETFWTLSMKQFRPLMKAYQEKLEYEDQRRDYQAWLTGLYIGNALGMAFGGGDYPDLPYTMQNDEIENKEDSKKDDEIAASKFAEWANIFNKKQSEVVTNA